MTTLREAAQQALEALEGVDGPITALLGGILGSPDPDAPGAKVRAAITALETALAQPDDWTRCHHCGQSMPPVPLRQAEPDLSRCPQCNGPADNGHDRSIPPSPYLCTKCMAEPCPNCASLEAQNTELDRKLAEMERTEPVQEPVAWLQPKTVDAHSRPDLGYETCSKDDYGAFPVHTAPPRRTMVPLTEQEIWGNDTIMAANALLGARMDALVEIARAVEKASWKKNYGQT